MDHNENALEKWLEEQHGLSSPFKPLPPLLPLPQALKLGISTLQTAINTWRMKQPFGPGQPVAHGIYGLVEELGELARAQLKGEQGIRGTLEEHDQKAQDAIGDIFIWLAGYASARGWSLAHCIEMALAEVLARDWEKYPETGKP